MDVQKIVLIGAGNVGWHLGHALYDAGQEVVQVFSRKAENAAHLAKAIGSQPCHQLQQINANADLYICAVHDQAIPSVAEVLAAQIGSSKLVVHTSGATPSEALAEHFPRYGVFYPLQSFSKEKAVDFTKVPMCIFAKAEEDQAKLLQLAHRISQQVAVVNDEQRAGLHVAAVFVNNFVNQLFQIGYEICQDQQLPFEMLLPLMQETLDKVRENEPAKMQTGPAQRGDQATMERHLKRIEGRADWIKIYTLLSEIIAKQKEK